MDVVKIGDALGALRSSGPGDDAFVHALVELIPCQGLVLLDLVPETRQDEVVELVPWAGDDSACGDFWDYFWDCAACSYTQTLPRLAATPCATTDFYSAREWASQPMLVDFFAPAGIQWDLVIPLPAPPDVARRLVLFREPGRAFSADDTALAALLRPALVDALRRDERRAAAGRLTERQYELVRLCAAGLDNTRIARRLQVSPGTVRKHLENAFARLGVTSRGEAVAALFPDLQWDEELLTSA